MSSSATLETLEYPEVFARGWTAAQLLEQQRMNQPLTLYRRGRLSTGAAADFANVPQYRTTGMGVCDLYDGHFTKRRRKHQGSEGFWIDPENSMVSEPAVT